MEHMVPVYALALRRNEYFPNVARCLCRYTALDASPTDRLLPAQPVPGQHSILSTVGYKNDSKDGILQIRYQHEPVRPKLRGVSPPSPHASQNGLPSGDAPWLPPMGAQERCGTDLEGIPVPASFLRGGRVGIAVFLQPQPCLRTWVGSGWVVSSPDLNARGSHGRIG